MKKIVNGEVYDTDMATSVVMWYEETHVSGITVKVRITLNRAYSPKDGVDPEDALKVYSWGGISVDTDKVDTTKGKFFLSYDIGSYDESSKRIVPISDAEAKSIVEERCSFDEYVRLFGDPRGLVITPDAVRKAVEKGRNEAKTRISELEKRIQELENR